MTKRNLFGAFLAFIIITAVSAVLIHLWLHRAPPPSVKTAENALAAPDLFAIGHINHSRLTDILAMTTGKDDPDPFVLPGVEANLWNDLYRGTVNLHKNTDQILFGLRVDPQTQVSSAALMSNGQFDWTQLQPVLNKYYQIQADDHNNYRLTAIPQSNNTKVCPSDEQKIRKKSPYIWLHASPDWLIVTTDEAYLKQIRQRMNEKAQAEIDLSHWQHYRKSRLASIGLLAPESVSKTSGISGFILGGAAKSNPEVNRLFLGASISYQPVGVSFNLQMDTNNPQWVKDKQVKAETLLAKIAKDAGTYSPSLVELMSGLSVSADDTILNIDANIRVDTVKKIPDMVKESITSIFSFGSVASNGNQTLVSESINESPWNFSLNQELSQLPNFAANEFSPNYSWVQGPLAVNVNNIQLGKENHLLELKIEAALQLMEKGDWSGSKTETQLFIKSVTNIAGQELLRDELCLKDFPRFTKKNRDPSSGINELQGQFKLRKTIRLNKGSNYDEIQSIKGHVILTAPIDVKRIPLEFKQGASIEHAELRFYLKSTHSQSISYRISGDIDKLVEIRAFNQKGKVLDHHSSFSSGSSGNNSYRGNIHRIEIYVAENQLNKRFDFELGANDIIGSNVVTKPLSTLLP